MLYDNAQLVDLYAEAYRITKDPNYARIIRETLGFIKREMTADNGAFYSALDADSNGVEGEFYVWTPEQIDKVLPDKTEAALIKAVYGVTGNPNFEEKFFILKLGRPLADIAKDHKLTLDELNTKLAVARAKLLEFRGKRERPFLDTKNLTAWNGQMIAGFAKAGEILKEPEYTKAAARAADFMLTNVRNKDGRLLRTHGLSGNGVWGAKLNAYLDDYAFLTHGLLNLYDATGQKHWLDESKSLTDIMVKWYGEEERGGFFYTSSDHEKLFARPKDYYDGAQPSANGVAARNLVRLWRITKDDKYRKEAEKSLKQFAGVLRANPGGVPGMALALHQYLDAKGDKLKADPGQKEPGAERKDPKTEDVVKIGATLGKPIDGKVTITIKITVEKPWHIYANPTGNPMVQGSTAIAVRINGKPAKAEITYPEGSPIKDDLVGDYRVYEGEVTLKATIDSVDGPVEVTAKVQACTSGKDGRCLLPTTLKTLVK
jgi:uncharacterized protein YyaL (SSP411 family)